MDASYDGSSKVVRVTVPHNHDILLGRGGGVNSHPGNRRFRRWVNERKEAYTLSKTKKEKGALAKEVVDLVHGLSPPGRFLQHEKGQNFARTGLGDASGTYLEVTEEKALAKAAQALREGAPNLRAHFALCAKDHSQTAPIYGIGPTTLHVKLRNPNVPEADSPSSSTEEETSQEQKLGSAIVSSEGEDSGMQKSANDTDRCIPQKHQLSEEDNEPKTSEVLSDSLEESPAKKQKYDHERKGLANTDLELTEIEAPKQNDDRLHALATTCARQAPSPVEKVESADLSAPPLTPENNASTKLPRPLSQRPFTSDAANVIQAGLNPYPAILQALASEVALPSAFANPSFSAEMMLTPTENARLEKEKAVQEWLIMAVPHLHTDDIRAYTRRLVDDGFDSATMLNEELGEEDLGFMKKAHKRSLLRVQLLCKSFSGKGNANN